MLQDGIKYIVDVLSSSFDIPYTEKSVLLRSQFIDHVKHLVSALQNMPIYLNWKLLGYVKKHFFNDTQTLYRIFISLRKSLKL